MDLQKRLYTESLCSISEEGWEVFKEGDLTFFKSPVLAPFMDYAYGNVSFFSYQQARSFYGKKPFTWIIKDKGEEDLLLQWGFSYNEITYAMEMDLTKYTPITSDIRVKEVLSLEDYATWLAVFSKWIKLDSFFLEEFFTPWIKTDKLTLYLGFYKGIPVSTALVYCGSNSFIEGVGTLEEFRGKGVASAVTNACLIKAKSKALKRVSLYSSLEGKFLYEKMGFDVVEEMWEYKSPLI